MGIGRPGWSETWRVLVYTLVIALGFIALARLQSTLIGIVASRDLLARVGWVDTAAETALARQAAQVAADSSAAVQRLPAGHRLAAFRMGYELGYSSQLLGSVSRSNEGLQQRVRGLAEAHLAVSREMAHRLGVQEEAALPVRTLQEFGDLSERIEGDENGAAARIEQQLSPLHHHLFLLGAHVGTEAARIETTGGEISLPPGRLIGRHAMLAGIDAALWKPLAAMPNDETPAQVLARYRNALNALAAALAQPD